MVPSDIDRLRTLYPSYYHESIDTLPDGWTALVEDFLSDMAMIGGLRLTVSCRFERTSSGLKAFVFPEISNWHDHDMIAVRTSQRQLYGLSQQTCEICGNPGAIEDGRFLCIGHGAEGRAKAAREQALYDDVAILFPPVHGSAINLSVPDYLEELLASHLRKIKKIVESEGLAGKVQITRVEMDDGALFVRVRYTDLKAVYMGVQMAVNEIVSDLELLSDELMRRQRDGGSDAS